jgi:uncharacterized protein YbaR (Trm112 family)
MSQTVCPHCTQLVTYTAETLKKSPTREVRCRKCHQWFRVEVSAPVRSTDNMRRSRQQETRAAKRIGGRVQPASGSRPAKGAKGDIRKKGVIRGECKFTLAKSYSLKLEDLMKLEKQGGGLEKPMFEIEFQRAYPRRRYVVLRGEDFDALISFLKKER